MFCDVVDRAWFVFGLAVAVGVGVGIAGVAGVGASRRRGCMNYADFALCVLAVTFENGDMFRIGGDCAAFEEDERMCVTASLL